MAAMLRDSVVVVVVVVVVVRTRPRAIPLAMIAIRKILHGFPFLSRDAYGAPLGGPSGRRSSAIKYCYSNLDAIYAKGLLLWFWFYDTQMKTTLMLSFVDYNRQIACKRELN